MKKNKIVNGALASAMALTGVMPVFASSPASGSTLETKVQYQASETEWLWSVPATQTFTDSNLTKTGDVSITPANSGEVIILNEGTQMDISINSANSFKLQNTTKSAIPYEVKKGGTVLANDDNVLHFEAGVSANTGVSQTLSFETTASKIKEAKLIGQHTDVVTFNLNVQAPRIIAATFTYGDELTWDELKLSENGESYGYDASAITDTSIGSAFCYCTSLISITIPKGVTSIGDNAFSNCYDLTSITIPEGVTSIGYGAFYSCHSLTDINYNGTQEQWNAITKDDTWNYDTGTIIVHCTDGDITETYSE